MRIRSLYIHSYKSFLKPALIRFTPRVNVLIGPNNCGKTNILDAIDFVAHPDKKLKRLKHHRAAIDVSIELNDDEKKSYGIHDSIVLRGRQTSVNATDPSHQPIGISTAQAVAQHIKMLRLEDFDDIARIEQDYTHLAQRYPAAFELLQNLLKDNFPEVQAIQRIADVESEHFGTVSANQQTITIDRLGGGFRRVLIMLLYSLHPEYSIVLIDEPEIHLHPSMIKRLLKMFRSHATSQIIMTTHSPVFIRAGSMHEVYRVLKDDEGSHVYYLTQSQHRIDLQRLVQELNADNLEMFFADKVLLVEGVSDRILMRGLIDRFYHGTSDIKVIDTHGKSNIDVYVDLMKIFHIPYAIMLDRDALPLLWHQAHVRDSGVTRGDVAGSIRELRKRGIFILENGTIEHNYPRKYQHRDSKPLSALYAATSITDEEYRSHIMLNIRSIIESL